MEVLKNGKSLSKEFIGKCRSCGCVVKALKHELHVIPGDYRNDNEDYAHADCPDCSGKLTVCFHEVESRSGRSLIAEEGLEDRL